VTAVLPHPLAALLLGPTGSGKTPLGARSERNGLAGRACHHFDFGSMLRRSIHPSSDLLHPKEKKFIRNLLKRNLLLEPDHFPIAERLFLSFYRSRSIQPDDLILMNGLPRHLEQARSVQSLVHIRTVAVLQCSTRALRKRIRMNTGGDRSERTDDSLPSIRKKLAIYNERTRPLVDYYIRHGCSILRIRIGIHTSPFESWEKLNTGFSRIILP